MSIDLSVLVHQLLLFLLMAAAGYLALRTHLLPESVHASLPTLVMQVTLPALMIVSYVGMDITGEPLVPYILIGGFVMFAVQLLLGILSGRLCGLRGLMQRGHLFCSCFGSIGYFAIPLMNALYGAKGVFFTSLYMVVDGLLTYTFGMWCTGASLTGGGKGERWKLFCKCFFNPAFIGMCIGIVVSFLPVKRDNVVFSVMDAIGNCCSPLVMLYIGGNLAHCKLRDMKTCWQVYTLPVSRMLLAPVLLFLVTELLGWPREASLYLAIISAVPVSSNGAVLSAENGSPAVTYCSLASIITVLLTLLTLPAAAWIINRLAG